jgi:hypothetical protein
MTTLELLLPTDQVDQLKQLRRTLTAVLAEQPQHHEPAEPVASRRPAPSRSCCSAGGKATARKRRAEKIARLVRELATW